MAKPVYTVGSLFSGIGGIDLGLERTGRFRVVWQSEIDPYASAVLAKHWPEVPNHGDITRIDWQAVERPDVLVGGFPCQPHSVAGKRKASADSRDLWPEYRRAIEALRPSLIVAENVPGLLTSERGAFFARLLNDLAQLGYDAEWTTFAASEIGAPHRRARVWTVAYPNGAWQLQPEGLLSHLRGWLGDRGPGVCRGQWDAEPDVGRMADGVPARARRLRCLGNAVVPQAAQLVALACLTGLDTTPH